ncbi:MAG: segregation/condensation protein A [Ruminiclostridium sp.]|nr:segregation/condensation protein A [Ruminiclostridium sp.]
MERPVYYIKGVVKEKTRESGDFVGPLDLILHLMHKNKIAIRDIPLADLLDQYLAWVSARREMDLEVAGEFIAMASHLMLLKTRMLLHEEDQEAKEEMEALMASLEARERHAFLPRIRAVLPQLEDGFQQGKDAFPKEPEAAYARRVYRYEHRGEDLTAAMEAWRQRQGQALPPDWKEFQAVVRREPYRVEQKVSELLELLKAEGATSLTALVARSRSRSEVTAVFLAMLELCRGGKVHLAGTLEEPMISVAEQ